jgi:glycosyltransferase involved in cell wall biosynthesis
MVETGARPLVTFYVMAYNQVRFIREAVEGALAQTYSPLEIVLSDDCSTDGTFEIIQEVASSYTGPHTVVVNRNPHKLGVSEHVNKIIERAAGELIIAADGDDISSPNRAERCVEAWLKNGKPAALFSSVFCIDAAGRPSGKDGDRWFAEFLPKERETPAARLLRFSKDGSPRLVSCSGAWTKELCDAFGPLSPRVWFEDDVITLRAWLYDRIIFVPEALVRYREHDSNVFNRVKPPPTTRQAREDAEAATRTEARRRRECLRTYLSDLELAVRRHWITRSLCDEIKRQVEARCALYQVIEDWWSVGWPMRLALLLFVIRTGRVSEGLWCSPRLLPFHVFLVLGAIWSRTRVAFKRTDTRTGHPNVEIRA